ncbi:MAG: YhbY family RNA-binding protein [bacterium]
MEREIKFKKILDSSLLDRSKAISPILWIGKKGITDSVIDELKKLLKKKKLVKIKLLRSFIEENNKKEVAKNLAIKTDSMIINVVGFTITLYKEENKNEKFQDKKRSRNKNFKQKDNIHKTTKSIKNKRMIAKSR